MRMRTIALAGIAALCLTTPATASDAQGWYLGLGAGWDHLGNIDLRYAPNGGNDILHSSNAALFAGSLGYRLPNGIRIELELGWDRHDLHSTGIGSTNDNGRISNLTGALNALYDWRITNRWAFSFGGGVGVARTDLDVSAPNPAGGVNINVANGRQSGFMAQAIAGFTYSVTDNIDLGLDWRYRELAGNNFSTSRPFAGADLRDNNEQVVMLGVRWYFESAPPPPPPPPPVIAAVPAPPPPPPVAPPPPPPVKTFIVFFDFNKSNLTAEAQAVVSEAVKTAKQQGAVRVVVTGHTDTVGSHSYNQGLSEHRAASVKEEMVREGLGADEIATEGKSFDDPLVPTGPGVREPQNRRAVIDLGGGS